MISHTVIIEDYLSNAVTAKTERLRTLDEPAFLLVSTEGTRLTPTLIQVL